MKTKTPLQRFISNAERQWFRVFFSGKKTRLRARDGAPLELLPKHLDTKKKIYSYFRRYWGRRIARRMIANMPFLERNGHLYVIAYDAGPVPIKVLSTKIICCSRRSLIVLARLGGIPGRPACIVYRLVKRNSGCFVIVERMGPRYDYRYYPPPRANGSEAVRAFVTLGAASD